MRKPIVLNKTSGGITASFSSNTLKQPVTVKQPVEEIPVAFKMNNIETETEIKATTGKFETDIGQIHYITPPRPDWAQNDPDASDYVINKHLAEQYRPITIDGEEFLGEERNSGPLDIVGEGGIIITTDGNSLHLSVEDYVEGEAIDITDDKEGKKIISIEPDSLNDKHITGLSIGKLTQNLGEKIIIYGGNANGWE